MSEAKIEWGRGEPGSLRRAGDVLRLPDGTWIKLPPEIAKAFDALIPSGSAVEVALSLVANHPTAAPALLAAGAKVASDRNADPTALIYEGARELSEGHKDWSQAAETAAAILAAALRALL